MKRTLLGLALVAAAIWLGRRAARRSQPTPTYHFEASQIVSASPAETFRFFEDPQNLARLTPPALNFQIVKIDGLPMATGTTIEYRIRLLGRTQRWRSLIVDYEQGHRFVDIQTSGPYSYWRHEHRFEEADGKTRMSDRVEYRLPYGRLGAIAQRVLVARQLRQIFDYRSRAIQSIFGESAAG